MGYTKIVQFGNVIEHYSYEKNIKPHRERHISQLTKKRQKQSRLLAKSKGTYQRSKQSVRRSQNNFFRLCHHNNESAKSIHFVTLTFAHELTYSQARRHVARFMEKITKCFSEISITYISVPELTKKGRYHFHLLVYDLPPEASERERETRNFQRLFGQGFLDIRFATYNSVGIAGYMAKYMGKALGDAKNEAERGYNCSRGIKRFYSAGSNSLDNYTDLIIPQSGDIQTREYDVPWLGKCIYKKIIN